MNAPINRLADLDLLRFLAAMAVVFYHLTYTTFLRPISQFGYLGVDLFFMISGFVILWSAQGATAREFVVSRFSRLYPAFWLCMALTIIALWVMRGEMPSPAKILGNATMLGGYTGHEYIDGVYWTLQVELKFYIIILGLILIRQIQNVEFWLYAWLAVCLADVTVGMPGAIRMLIIAPYGPLFIAGCLFYLIRQHGLSPNRVAGILVCMALAAWNAIPNSEQYLFGERSYLAPAIVIWLFGIMGAVALRIVRIPGSSALFTLAAITYPLYLLHNEIGKAISEHSGPIVGLIAVVLLAYAANAIDRPIASRVRGALAGGRRREESLPASAPSSD